MLKLEKNRYFCLVLASLLLRYINTFRSIWRRSSYGIKCGFDGLFNLDLQDLQLYYKFNIIFGIELNRKTGTAMHEIYQDFNPLNCTGDFSLKHDVLPEYCTCHQSVNVSFAFGLDIQHI